MNKYSRGDIVEVLSQREIYATLDKNGALGGLPFMPEMSRFCGRRFRVARRADRTCVEGLGERLMDDAIFLEDVRCDGAAHDGCQRDCLVFWKEQWVKPVTDDGARFTEDRAEAAQDLPPFPVKSGDRYYCQSTELARITRTSASPLLGSLRMLVADLFQGEINPGRLLLILGWAVLNKASKLLRLTRLGPPAGPGTERSKGQLGLKTGDLVEIRPLSEIRTSLDQNGKNAGLTFDPEMIVYKGTYEVERPVEQIILETSGKMRKLTNTVTLKGISCQGLCAKNCPRANPIYWREIWLKKLPGKPPQPEPRPAPSTCAPARELELVP